MTKKKIDSQIVGFGNDPENKLTVQKSLPLFALWRSGLTLAEFKIMDTYLSRIDSHKPENRAVVFSKGELENLLGLKQIKPDVLDARLRHLMETTVELKPTGSKSIDRITLFERAQADQDDYGQWTAILTCTPSAMKYIFNIEKIRYLRYKLRCVTSIKSLYSYILFTYLERNRYRKTWEEDLDELRRILNCDTDASYSEFKIFNNRILKKCQTELCEKSECRFTYEPVKKGRKVIAVKFTLETINDLIQQPDPDTIPGQLTLDDVGPSMHEEHITFLSGACNNEFSPEEMEEIWTIICDKDLPADPQGVAFAQYHCLARVYAKLNVEAARRKIAYRHKYYLSILRSDLAKG